MVKPCGYCGGSGFVSCGECRGSGILDQVPLGPVLDVEGRGRCRALIVGHGAWRADGVRLDSQGETLEGAQRRVRWRLFDKVKGRPVDLLQLFTLR